MNLGLPYPLRGPKVPIRGPLGKHLLGGPSRMVDARGGARRWRFHFKLLKYPLGTLCGFYLALYEKPFLYDKYVCDGLGHLGLGHLRCLRYSKCTPSIHHCLYSNTRFAREEGLSHFFIPFSNITFASWNPS